MYRQQDTLRGSTLRALPFLDSTAVLDLLDRAPAISQPEVRNGAYSGLTLILSMCVLQERYRLAA